MIFIGLFLFIALIIVALNMHNSSNLNMIENYLNTNNCNTYIYSKGSYKALCEDKIIEIENSFSVDLQKNSKDYRYNNIKDMKINNLDIIINKEFKLSFKEKIELDKFYIQLEKKLKN